MSKSHTSKRQILSVATTATLVALGHNAQAGDLFSITATGLANPVVGNSVVDLVNNLIGAQGAFSSLYGSPINGSLTYAGVPNAILFQENAAGTSASLNIPSTGLNKTFTGMDSAELQNQIEDYLKKNGASELAKFYKAMAGKSLVAVSDGNPNSTTAFAASQSYGNYGMTLGETKEEKEAPKEAIGRAGLGIIADVGTFDANGIKGTSYSLPLYARFKLTDRVGLNLDIPVSYIEIEGAKVFGLGLGVGLPVKVVPRTKGSPWYWQLTPFAGANASGSKDLAAGGLLANGGLNSLVS